MLATLISRVLDHARTNFSNPWLWVPTAVGVLGIVVAFLIALVDRPIGADVWIYIGIMLLIILVGSVGMLLHILTNLGTSNTVIGERFLRGAPILAPLLFADIATLGLLVLLDPHEQPGRTEQEGAQEETR